MGYNPVRDALIGYGFAEQQRNLEQAREQSAGRYEREQELNRRQDYEYNLARISRDAEKMAMEIQAANTDPKTGKVNWEGVNQGIFANNYIRDLYEQAHPNFAGFAEHPSDSAKAVVLEKGPNGEVRAAAFGDDDDPNAEVAVVPNDSKYGAVRNGLQMMAGLNPEWYKGALEKLQEKYKNQENSVLSAAMWDAQAEQQQGQGSVAPPPGAGLGAATAGAPAGAPAGTPAGTPDNALLTGELDLRGAAAAGAATGASTTTQEKTAPVSTKTLAEQQKEKDANPDLVTRGVNTVLENLKFGAGKESRSKAVVDAALDLNDDSGDQVRRNPDKWQPHYAAVRDQYTPEQQKQLDTLFNPAGQGLKETPMTGRIQRNAKDETAVAGTEAKATPPEQTPTQAPASTTKAKNAETVNQMMANPQQTVRTNGTAAAGAIKAAATQAGYRPNSKLRAQMIKMVAEGNLSMEGVMHVLEIAKGPKVEWHTIKQGGKNAPDLLVGTVGRNVVATIQGNNYAPTAEPLTLDDYKDINTAIATFVNQMHDKDNENGPTKQELYRNFNATIMGLGGNWQLAVLPNFQSLLAQGIELQRRMTDDNGMLPFGDTIRSGSWLPGTMATAFGLTDDPNEFLQDYWMPGYNALRKNNQWTGNPNIDEPRMYQILTNARAQVRDTGIDPQTAIQRIVLNALGVELPPEPTPTQE